MMVENATTEREGQTKTTQQSTDVAAGCIYALQNNVTLVLSVDTDRQEISVALARRRSH